MSLSLSLRSMLHVVFKKSLCRRVKFNGTVFGLSDATEYVFHFLYMYIVHETFGIQSEFGVLVRPSILGRSGSGPVHSPNITYIMQRIWEKGPIGNFSSHENKFDCRETTLTNAANHLKIFMIEFEICLFKHLYFLCIGNPLFPIVGFMSMLRQLKVNMFYPKNSFPIV